ncbi:hypothetical protein TNCV_4290551 [Trichonephila clavipes]|nr:hypothetical protein TNCV_4290551 [Trichonephila clavipes]
MKLPTYSPYLNSIGRALVLLADLHKEPSLPVSVRDQNRFELGVGQIPSRTPRCYTRAFGDGPSNFEPWSSDVDDT